MFEKFILFGLVLCSAAPTAFYYTISSNEESHIIERILPLGCSIDAKLDFGTGLCCTYRVKCVHQMTKETKEIVAKSVGYRLVLQEDPIVKNIVTKTINPISDGSAVGTSAGYDNNFGPLLAANIRGQGIRVVLLDDGLQVDHPDLSVNVNSSYTLNLSGEETLTGKHGTSCAGLIAAAAANEQCIVGAAPVATLGAVKMIGFEITASQEAQALMSFLAHTVHVYSNSWGPADDGETTAGPSDLSLQAIHNGVTN
ncbi:hypothetical protein Ciccas_007962, partial [Cichlidogyrus casuarinus]